MRHLMKLTALIKKYKKVAGTNKMAYDTGTSVPCHLQPLSAEQISYIGEGAIGKSFRAWMPQDTDIREGDLIIIDTVEYKCKGVMDYNFPNLKHKEVLLNKPL